MPESRGAEAPRDCPLCDRLVDYRAANRAAHPDWYNGAVPSFGDAAARLLIVGLAPGLTVNGIALGAILPPIDGNKLNESVDNLPIPRWANLEEVEDTVLFLLSGPGYITGEVIHLDGGRHLI